MRPSRSRDADTRLPAVGRLLGIDRDRMQPLNPTVHLVLADCAESVAVERAIWELAHRLPRPRFEVRAWLASDPARDAFAAALEDRGVPVDRMPTPGATWSWRGMFDAWIKLRRVRPALLHVHHGWPTSEGVSAALCETAGVRHRIVSVHGPSAPHEMQPVSRKAFDQADVVTTVCGTYAEQLVCEGGVDRERVRYVPAGGDPPSEEAELTVARAIRDRFGTGPIRPLFVYAGRLEPYRGAAVFVEALGLAAPAEPSRSWPRSLATAPTVQSSRRAPTTCRSRPRSTSSATPTTWARSCSPPTSSSCRRCGRGRRRC